MLAYRHIFLAFKRRRLSTIRYVAAGVQASRVCGGAGGDVVSYARTSDVLNRPDIRWADEAFLEKRAAAARRQLMMRVNVNVESVSSGPIIIERKLGEMYRRGLRCAGLAPVAGGGGREWSASCGMAVTIDFVDAVRKKPYSSAVWYGWLADR